MSTSGRSIINSFTCTEGHTRLGNCCQNVKHSQSWSGAHVCTAIIIPHKIFTSCNGHVSHVKPNHASEREVYQLDICSSVSPIILN